jgi:hypothetical protein
MNEDRMKGVCLDCQAQFSWTRFMQGSKLCEPCEKVLMQKRKYGMEVATQYIINEQLLNPTTKESV